MFGHDGMGYVGWWGLGLGMVVFWALVIVGIVLAVRWAAGPRSPDAGAAPHRPPRDADRPDAQWILDQRYARGEIDEQEYRRRRDVLRGD
ncbi:SHOCT domain-containing protein [Phycicoccus sp.]|uniref:SHOCT domain-containing protein n=1 Tax=Phycicoccus sp. TaxID=1902410 RepID=UPI002CA70E46|nr:SHOCT domain-containing protein [Phycicoccus sp.]HMM94714.1 SHOCT domain-containing protein [Phycicoccus sp.]